MDIITQVTLLLKMRITGNVGYDVSKSFKYPKFKRGRTMVRFF